MAIERSVESPILHQQWHDLESVFWTAIFALIRHGQQLTIQKDENANVLHLTSDKARKKALDTVFEKAGVELDKVANSKRDFLLAGTISVLDNEPLTSVLSSVQEIFGATYRALERNRDARQAYSQASSRPGLKSLSEGIELDKSGTVEARLISIQSALHTFMERITSNVTDPTVFSYLDDNPTILTKLKIVQRDAQNSADEFTPITHTGLLALFDRALRRSWPGNDGGQKYSPSPQPGYTESEPIRPLQLSVEPHQNHRATRSATRLSRSAGGQSSGSSQISLPAGPTELSASGSGSTSSTRTQKRSAVAEAGVDSESTKTPRKKRHCECKTHRLNRLTCANISR